MRALPSPDLLPYTTRALTILDAEELRDVRLESLLHYGAIFKKYHDDLSSQAITYWEDQCTPTNEHCFFGLFYEHKLVGVMATRIWEEDTSGQTAFWWGNYTKPNFRGIGATKCLYIQRINWGIEKGCTNAVAYTRDGAQRPAEIFTKIGGTKTHSEMISHGGGEPALWHWYIVPMPPPKEEE